jgi:protein-S-isoprenylcysteine O-methyltransferase Ste14
MDALVRAVGLRPGIVGAASFVALISLATGAWLAGPHLAAALGAPLLAMHAAIWAGWLVWLRHVFPRRRRRELQRPSHLRYRRAFYWDVLPGISCTFAQLGRPLVEGAAAGAPVASGARPAIAVAAVAAGLGLIAVAARRLGLARTLFLEEYADAPPALVTDGVYQLVRHPLFIGGVIASSGCALLFVDAAVFGMALANAAVVPLYAAIEDVRCVGVFGARYRRYRFAVHAIIPRGWIPVRLDRDWNAIEDGGAGQRVHHGVVGQVVDADPRLSRRDGQLHPPAVAPEAMRQADHAAQYLVTDVHRRDHLADP